MEMPIPPPLEVAAHGDGQADHDQNIVRRSLNYKIHNNSSIEIDIEGEKVQSANQEDLRSETSSIGVCSSISEASVSSAADENDDEVQSKRIDIDDPNSNSNSLHQQHELHLHLELDSNPNTNESSLTSLDSLEDSLPFKRGLSNFYCGKSKSFTSLSNVANATAKDLIKPENPLNKRRRLLIAWSHNRRASCSNLVSIAESPLLPLPPVVSECDEEDEEDEDEVEDALVTTVVRRTRSDKETKRPSLFTVSVSRQQVFNEYDNDPPLAPFLTPKPSITGTKMPLRLPGRSFSLSDLSQHTNAHAPP